MAGYRAAGWTCCGTLVLSLLVAIVGMRGMGIVGQNKHEAAPSEKSSHGAIELTDLESGGRASLQDIDDTPEDTYCSPTPVGETAREWGLPSYHHSQHGITLSQKLKVFEQVV